MEKTQTDSKPKSTDAGSESTVLEYLYQISDEIRFNIQLADQKAGFVALLLSVMIAGIASLGQNGELIKTLSLGVNNYILIVAITFIAISSLSCALAMYPRTGILLEGQRAWVDLARADIAEVVESTMTESLEIRSLRIVHHLKSLSIICERKFRYIRWAIVSMFVSLMSMLILLGRVLGSL